MKKSVQLQITISRQLGSGGSYVGQQLAKRLDLFYADREIIRRTAKELAVLEEDLTSRDERVLSFWETFLQYSAYTPEIYIPPRQIMPPTDIDVFEKESEIIERIAKRRPAVFIGRCGFHILRDYPGHVGIFLHAQKEFRSGRLQKLYDITKEDADRMIEKSDKERSVYCRTFAGTEWHDAENYDLAIDTGKTDLEKCVELILNYIS